MKFTSFLFICGWYLALVLFGNSEWLGGELQLLIAAVSILLVGIPHGAIDHIIFFEENKKASMYAFYIFYVCLMVAYVVMWLYVPFWSFVFFLVLSAFHFGQSQFSDIKLNNKVLSWGLYLTWGCSILSGLIIYNTGELSVISTQFPDMGALSMAFDENFHIIFLCISTISFILIKTFIFWNKQISSSRFFMELFLFGLIHVSFFTLPLVIGFTLYFCTLHSTRVLVEEFNFLKLKRKNFNLRKFIQLLIPYTFLSVIGIMLFLAASHYNWISISNFLLVLILTSIVTLPHSFVMDGFYKKNKLL